MADPIATSLDAFAQSDVPRKRRGVRHPYSAFRALALLGLLCRQTDLASLQRWAKDHWRTLKDTLGFTRKKPPHATTIGRAWARCPLEQFRGVFVRGLTSRPRTIGAVTVAVAGKTRKQGHDAAGDPIPMLNVFAHDLNLCLAQFPTTGGKPTEPQAREHALQELLERYPFLRRFTGDAVSCQRPLAPVLLDADRDFLCAVKDNRPELLEAIRTSFHDAPERTPDAKAVEKRGVAIHTRRPRVRGGEEVESIREATHFPGLDLILGVDCEVTQAGVPIRSETRHAT